MEFVHEGDVILAEEGFSPDGKPLPQLRRTISSPNDIGEAFSYAFNELQEDEDANLVTWGKQHPSQFYGIVARLAPKEVKGDFKGDISIKHILPRSPLDE